MRQGPNNKRMRGRGNGRKHPNPRNQSFESNGPEVKVRGNPQQIVEKYLTLARDASSAGDRITAESYYQFAEHYYRIMNANAAAAQSSDQRPSTPAGDNYGDDQQNSDDDGNRDRQQEQAAAPSEDKQPSSGGRRRNGRNNGRRDPSDSPQPDVEANVPAAAAADEKSSDDASEAPSA